MAFGDFIESVKNKFISDNVYTNLKKLGITVLTIGAFSVLASSDSDDTLYLDDDEVIVEPVGDVHE